MDDLQNCNYVLDNSDDNSESQIRDSYNMDIGIIDDQHDDISDHQDLVESLMPIEKVDALPKSSNSQLVMIQVYDPDIIDRDEDGDGLKSNDNDSEILLNEPDIPDDILLSDNNLLNEPVLKCISIEIEPSIEKSATNSSTSTGKRNLRPRRKKPPNNKKRYLESDSSSEDENVENDYEKNLTSTPSKKARPNPKLKDDKLPLNTDEMTNGTIVDNNVEENVDDSKLRKCLVCLRRQPFTEDIMDENKHIYSHIEPLLGYLNIKTKGAAAKDSGICPECLNQLQRWHIFHSTITKRRELATNTNVKIIDAPLSYIAVESRVYRNYKKMAKVKEVYYSRTHAHYARRHITERDWDFFCENLFHSNSVKSVKSKELESFLTSKEKLSLLFCTKCDKMIPDGKSGYVNHMESEHQENPILYPCEICGNRFPSKDMSASTEDYYPHWISHFYFNKCIDCGKNFPTKRALGQHRHAVHKNRQVKCEKCGKLLANKLSLDLHLLRHLPENEKKQYMIKCKLCKKKIAKWNFKSHMVTHNNNERPWKCDHCEATFKMKGALVSHRDVVHFNLKNHVCSICGEAFKSASSLRGHVRRHEGRKDYKCDVCDKEYYTYSALKGHKVVHQTERDFICSEPQCGKAFKKKKALEEHFTLHTGKKPYSCPICGREIRVKSNLYKHMKIHKKNTPTDTQDVNNINSSYISSSRSRKKMNSIGQHAILTSEPDIIHNTDNIITTTNSMLEEATTTLSTQQTSNQLPTGTIIMISNDSLVGRNISRVQNQNSAETPRNFINSHILENGNVVHSITMHQDLINVPVQTSNFFNTSTQYFTTLDQIQN